MHEALSKFFRPARLAAPALAGLAAGLLAAGCATGGRPEAQGVRWLVDHGQFDEAVRVAAEAVERAPNDAGAVADHRMATVAWWIEKGRRLTFQDQDKEALEAFRAALALEPESPVIRSWIDKTRLKLAEHALAEALELHANDQMPEALEAYERALSYDPSDESARTGREISLLLLQYRSGLGERYFKEGLEAASDYWLEFARARFSYAEKYQGDEGRAAKRRGEVQKLLAVQRIAAGRQFEEDARFGAARSEYRIALALDPDSEDAKAGMERAQVEMDVAEKLRTARLEVVRRRYEKAQTLAEEALAETRQQKELAEGVLAELRDARFQRTYEDALALERDGRFPEAVQRYDELLGEAQYYRDAIARRDTLKEYVQRAAELYAQVGQAASPEEQLGLLRQIELFWPGYRDVKERIAALEAQVATPDGAASGGR